MPDDRASGWRAGGGRRNCTGVRKLFGTQRGPNAPLVRLRDGSALDCSSGVGQVALGSGLPVQEALRFGEVVLCLELVAGDEDGVEAGVAELDRLQGGKIGSGEV